MDTWWCVPSIDRLSWEKNPSHMLIVTRPVGVLRTYSPVAWSTD